MPKDKNVGIKIELIKDKQSGKLKMVAHFDINSPNVIFENDEYMWIPTLEEKELIDEAFNFIPSEKTSKLTSDQLIDDEVKKPIKEEETEYHSEIKEEPPILEPEIQEETPEEVIDAPPIEKEEPSVFEVTGEESSQIEEKDEKEIEPELEEKQGEPEPPMSAKVEIKQNEEEYDEVKKDKKSPEDEGMIVEADADAIEAALKRHVGKEDRDDSFKEVDEQTIIDRVLSQKKKGKWAKK